MPLNKETEPMKSDRLHNLLYFLVWTPKILPLFTLAGFCKHFLDYKD